jgi:hypothetical protein
MSYDQALSDTPKNVNTIALIAPSCITSLQ